MRSKNKLLKPSSLKKTIETLRKRGKKIVFTNGCFDIIHPGHIKILTQAKKCGDILIAGLNSDKSIKKIKGKKRPIFSEKARIEIVSSLECVDYIILFDESTPYELIKKIKPQILVKGGDWTTGQIIGSDIAPKVVRVKTVKGYSTTGIIKRILKLYRHEPKNDSPGN